MRWTEDQQKAISARDGTLLVSAAAGSGKTAVLVERVLQRLEDEENGCDANELLIVTFTKAATAQMREKIAEALRKRIAAHPENVRLRRQQSLLPLAHISTIDSFCAQIVRENFQDLGIEPDYTILDDRQLAILQEEAASAVAEAMYAEDEDGNFAELSELLFQGRDDRKLIATMLKLNTEASAFVDPEAWLRGLYSRYDAQDEGLDVWQKMAVSQAKRIVRTCMDTLLRAQQIIRYDADVEKKYAPFLAEESAVLQAIDADLDTDDWDTLVSVAANAASRLPSPCPKVTGNHSYEKDAAKDAHNANKDRLKKLPSLFCATAAEHAQDNAYCRICIEKLSEAVLRYREALMERKRAENGFEFSDVSLFALQCLRASDGTQTPYAKTLSETFREILVDEFQDVNEAQYELFRLLSRDGKNLFMVGDAKQSIYKFRQARPDIFISLKDRFPLYDPAKNAYPALVLLDRNFRSRSGVTEWVNFVFRQLMYSPPDKERLYEVNYDEREYLRPAAAYPPSGSADAQLHVLRCARNAEARVTQESQYAAQWILRQLREGLTVTDGEVVRPATFGDFCILIRSDNGKIATIAQELTRFGIPVRAGSQDGFFDAPEIRFMISLLQVLDNPLQDVPLLAVMLSPVFGFRPDDPAALRVEDRQSSLYALIVAAAEKDARYRAFLDRLSSMRMRAVTLSAGDLIRYLLDETGYDAVALAMSGGEGRRANLRQLQYFAGQYEQTGRIGLSGFCRFLDRLRESGEKVERAKLSDISSDAVQIMTIHRSKGLEFPVVLLLNCAGNFNADAYKARYIFHPQFGMATIRRDAQRFLQYHTVSKRVLNARVCESDVNEEMRVLYVAMTRAKEKLIALASMSDPQKHLAALSLHAGTDGTIIGALDMKNYADLLVSASLRHPDAHALRDAGEIPAHSVMLPASFSLETVLVDSDAEQPLPEQTAEKAAAQPNEETIAQIRARTRYVYPYACLAQVAAKHIASAMQQSQIDPEFFASSRPAFLGAGGMTPAQRGTALHAFLQFADFACAAADPAAERDRLVHSGLLSEQEGGVLPLDAIRRLFAGPLGRRMSKADMVMREHRFTIEVDVRRLYPDLPDAAAGETTVIQGMVDCAFVENGSLVIVDYKTDRESPQVLLDRYRQQLETYRLAMAQCTAYPVSEVYLYSLHNHCEIRV